jgi:hypothetical protein
MFCILLLICGTKIMVLHGQVKGCYPYACVFWFGTVGILNYFEEEY